MTLLAAYGSEKCDCPLHYLQQLLHSPENYQMREVASLSLISGHNNSHPGTILTKERCPMVLHPPLAWRVVRSISSYLGMR